MPNLEQLVGFPVEGVPTHEGLPAAPALLRRLLAFLPEDVNEAKIVGTVGVPATRRSLEI